MNKPQYSCAFCGKMPLPKISKCSKCHWARYCGKKCQKSHWETRKHYCGQNDIDKTKIDTISKNICDLPLDIRKTIRKLNDKDSIPIISCDIDFGCQFKTDIFALTLNELGKMEGFKSYINFLKSRIDSENVFTVIVVNGIKIRCLTDVVDKMLLGIYKCIQECLITNKSLFIRF